MPGKGITIRDLSATNQVPGNEASVATSNNYAVVDSDQLWESMTTEKPTATVSWENGEIPG